MAKDWREIWDTATYEEWKKTLIAGGRQSGKSDAYEYYWSHQIYDTELEEKVDQAIWDVVCDKPKEVVTVDHILKLKDKFTHQIHDPSFGKISIMSTPALPNPLWGLHENTRKSMKDDDPAEDLNMNYASEPHWIPFIRWWQKYYPMIDYDVWEGGTRFSVRLQTAAQKKSYERWFEVCCGEAGLELTTRVCPYQVVESNQSWSKKFLDYDWNAILTGGPIDTELAERDAFCDGRGLLLSEVHLKDGFTYWRGSRASWEEICEAYSENMKNQPGIAGNNNRSENMNDYTNTVQGQLDERDRANKEIEKQQLKITRDITSKIGDLAVIHTDDAGVLDRFALGTSLDKTLLPFGFVSVDQVDDGD